MTQRIIVVFLAASFSAFGGSLYFQGFETDSSGWYWASGSPGGIAMVPSGTNGINAASGSYYGQVANSPDAYSAELGCCPGYGDGGYGLFGGTGSATAYPGSAYSESIDVFVNVNTPAPSTGVAAFWIDFTPTTLVTDAIGCGSIGCGDEHNFQLLFNGSSVAVDIDGGSPTISITSSGWYTFQATYAQGANPTDLVQTNMNVLTSGGVLVGTMAVLGNSDGETLLSSDLGGPGYLWLPAWQNGFSNDVLAVDNIRADTTGASVPEPGTFGLLGSALVGVIALARKLSARRV